MLKSRRASMAHEHFESLEPRQLLASGFNPDGPVVATPSQAPTSIITADFDGDSKPDLVMSVGREIIFQKGGGGGRFGAARVLARLNTDAGLLGAGDFNNDGRMDLFSVEKGRLFGWTRALVNTGEGRFTITSYSRVQTGVDTLTVGNIDSDPEPEVLLEGKSPILTLVPGEIPDEVRVLDPQRLFITFGLESVFPFPALKFIDRGVAVTGFALAQPALADLFDTGVNNIIIGGRNSDDVQGGFVQAYAYADPNPFIFFPMAGDSAAAPDAPAPLFNPAGGPITLENGVASVGAADMNNDGKLDLVATTLQLLPSTAQFPSLASYEGKTHMFARTGAEGDFEFAAPATLETRELKGRQGMERVAAPEYRIVTIADLNTDGKLDLGISINQDFYGPRFTFKGGAREAAFVQLLQPDLYTLPPQTGLFVSSYVSRMFASGLSYEAVLQRTQAFLASDIRRIGRPDLFIADITNPLGPTEITVRYNVPGRTLVPFLS